MSIEKFRRYDLNLLIVLHVLLEERGVTAASRRLGMSQGAVSRALGRLREQLDDELLVRTGAAMVPTPRADALKAQLEALLHGLGLLFEPEMSVDLSTLHRTFTLAADDYVLSRMTPALVTAVSEAPQVSICFERLGSESLQRLAAGEVDVVIGVEATSVAGAIWTGLGTVPLCVAMRAQHPRIESELALDAYLEERHVDCGFGATTGFRVPSVEHALNVVEATDCVTVVPASSVSGRAAVQSFPLPQPLPSVSLSLGWHERVRRDPAHEWFRATVRGVAEQLFEL